MIKINDILRVAQTDITGLVIHIETNFFNPEYAGKIITIKTKNGDIALPSQAFIIIEQN